MIWTCNNCNNKMEIDIHNSGCYIRCDKCNQISFTKRDGTTYLPTVIGCKGCFNYVEVKEDVRNSDTLSLNNNYCLINPEGVRIGTDICPLLYAKHAEANTFYNLGHKLVRCDGVNIVCINKEQFDNFTNLFITLCRRRKYSYEVASGLSNTVDSLYEGNMCIINIKYLQNIIKIDYTISPTVKANAIFYENVLANWSTFLLSMSSFFSLITKNYNMYSGNASSAYLNCTDIVTSLLEKRYSAGQIK